MHGVATVCPAVYDQQMFSVGKNKRRKGWRNKDSNGVSRLKIPHTCRPDVAGNIPAVAPGYFYSGLSAVLSLIPLRPRSKTAE
ncbi:hypothetical protein AGOR_G00236580 [Albula goreensis]|uniref:Uncharacterized protein n=1 Tax=Albula goreensis TaxID=1534307 RepID=A0A8T3CGZ9_9TELE|nr:hypothetical protein AGOR_G00236580 [Albula goreensis]